MIRLAQVHERNIAEMAATVVPADMGVNDPAFDIWTCVHPTVFNASDAPMSHIQIKSHATGQEIVRRDFASQGCESILIGQHEARSWL